jgi:hypothetical protein
VVSELGLPPSRAAAHHPSGADGVDMSWSGPI